MSYEIYSGKAIEKLNTEQKISVSDSKIMIMKDFVNETLTTFCKQSEEFSQAVVQGGSFIDCMKYVAKGVGRAISDIEAIEKAVRFYFPTATISLSMRSTPREIIRYLHHQKNPSRKSTKAQHYQCRWTTF